MACESDKCEKYGLHHDYRDGIEVRKCEACRKDEREERSMKNMDRLEMLDMAINMLKQARISQRSLEEIKRKALLPSLNQTPDSVWAKHIYTIVRGGVGIIEANTRDIHALSEKDIYLSEDERVDAEDLDDLEEE